MKTLLITDNNLRHFIIDVENYTIKDGNITATVDATMKLDLSHQEISSTSLHKTIKISRGIISGVEEMTEETLEELSQQDPEYNYE